MTDNFSYIKKYFSFLGRKKSIELIFESNLTDRERKAVILRFIRGLSIKECAEAFNIEPNSFSKFLTKVTKKLYNWLIIGSEVKDISLPLISPQAIHKISI
jgi:predicted DNA binding protein